MNIFNIILPGLLIAISDFIYVNATNKDIAAFIFPLALITIIKTNTFLYTGKIGKIELSLQGLKQSVLILLGNTIGLSILLLTDKSLCVNMIESKLAIPYIDVLFKALMCGCLMYLAVSFTNNKTDFLFTILCVAGFILGKCEHIIADIGYFFIAKSFTLESMVFLLIVLLGNTIGAKVMNFFVVKCQSIQIRG